MLFHGKNEELQKYLTLTDSFPFMKIQCPLDIAAALAIATSTPVTEASRYIQCALYFSKSFKLILIPSSLVSNIKGNKVF